MRPLTKILTSLACASCLLVAAGCGESNAEKMAKEKERQRLEAEQQALRDIKKSNQAVSDISKKIGRKVEPMDLGVNTEKKAEAPLPAPPKN
jgi:Flp pilus assembly protein TadD